MDNIKLEVQLEALVMITLISPLCQQDYNVLQQGKDGVSSSSYATKQNIILRYRKKDGVAQCGNINI